MATGIVAVALYSCGQHVLAGAFLAVGCAGWVVLTGVFVLRALLDPSLWWQAEHAPGALTQVAAGTVLGSQFAALGWHSLAWAMLVLAVVLWLVLLPVVLASRQGRTEGAEFLTCVATQGLVVCAAPLLPHAAAPGLVVVLVVALTLYVLTAGRFRWENVLNGAGDHWVAGGALAISSLAAAKTVAASSPGGLHQWMRLLGLALWLFAAVVLAVLAVGEVVRPRLRYDIRRWSTVFPLGMFAAASGAVGRASGHSGLVSAARVLTWVAVAAWAVVAVGAVRAAIGHRRVTG